MSQNQCFDDQVKKYRSCFKGDKYLNKYLTFPLKAENFIKEQRRGKKISIRSLNNKIHRITQHPIRIQLYYAKNLVTQSLLYLFSILKLEKIDNKYKGYLWSKMPKGIFVNFINLY